MGDLSNEELACEDCASARDSVGGACMMHLAKHGALRRTVSDGRAVDLQRATDALVEAVRRHLEWRDSSWNDLTDALTKYDLANTT